MAFLWTPEEDWPARYVSENVTQLGYSAEDFLTGRIMYANIVHSEDIDRVRKELTRCCEIGKNDFLSIDTGSLQAKARSDAVEEKTFIQRDERGNVANFQGIVRDVTSEIKTKKHCVMPLRARKPLWKNKKLCLSGRKRWRPLSTTAQWSYFSGRQKSTGPRFYVSENVRQFGYAPEDFVSGRVLYGKIIHPEDLLLVELELEENCDEGGKEFNRQYRILTQTGEIRWVEEKTFIQRNQDGQVTNFQGIIEDITEKIKKPEK